MYYTQKAWLAWNPSTSEVDAEGSKVLSITLNYTVQYQFELFFLFLKKIQNKK